MLDLFSFRDIDSHYIINFFGIRLQIKHKTKINYVPVSSFGLNTEKREEKIILSLTSRPKRINTTHIAINSLLSQTVKPDELILWLAEEEFLNKEKDLPEELLKLKEYGLTIKWCEAIKNFKKLIPALREFPNDIIVTADDDIYYDKNMLKDLYEAYLKDKNHIYTRRTVRKELINDKFHTVSSRVSKYKHYTAASYLNTLNGTSGNLYLPHSLYKDALKVSDVILNDDYYFWAMAVLNHTKIKETNGFNFNINQIESAQESSFSKNKENDKEWANVVLTEYSQVLDVIKNDLNNININEEDK